MRLKGTQKSPEGDADLVAESKSTATTKVKKAKPANHAGCVQDGFNQSAQPTAFMDDGSVSTVTPRNRTKDGAPLHEVLAGGEPNIFGADAVTLESYLGGWMMDPLSGQLPGVSSSFERYQEGMASLDQELETLRFAQDQHLTYERDYYDFRRYYALNGSDAIIETQRNDRQISDDRYYYDLQATRAADALYDLDRRNREYYDDLNRRR